MANLNEFLTNIANAIRSKKGTTDKINAQNFASEIESIETGSGTELLDSFLQVGGIKTLTTDITNMTAYGCAVRTNLRNATFNRLIKIPSNAFKMCNALSTLTFKKADTIGIEAFIQCTELTNIYLGYDGVAQLTDTSAFDGGASNTIIHVRSEYAEQYATATNWSNLIASGRITIVGDYSD